MECQQRDQGLAFFFLGKGCDEFVLLESYGKSPRGFNADKAPHNKRNKAADATEFDQISFLGVVRRPDHLVVYPVSAPVELEIRKEEWRQHPAAQHVRPFRLAEDH